MEENARAIRLRVGENVQRLRLARGFSQEQLAERAGNTGKHVGQIERGEVNVGIDYLAGVAAALDLDVSTLFMSPTADTSGSPVFLVTESDLKQLEQNEQIVRRIRAAGALTPSSK